MNRCIRRYGSFDRQSHNDGKQQHYELTTICLPIGFFLSMCVWVSACMCVCVCLSDMPFLSMRSYELRNQTVNRMTCVYVGVYTYSFNTPTKAMHAFNLQVFSAKSWTKLWLSLSWVIVVVDTEKNKYSLFEFVSFCFYHGKFQMRMGCFWICCLAPIGKIVVIRIYFVRNFHSECFLSYFWIFYGRDFYDFPRRK